MGKSRTGKAEIDFAFYYDDDDGMATVSTGPFGGEKAYIIDWLLKLDPAMNTN